MQALAGLTLRAEAWSTHVGLVVASLLRAPYCVRLFAGADAESGARLSALEGQAPAAGLQGLLEEVEREFGAGNFRVGRFQLEVVDSSRKSMHFHPF